jgi:hypothetical protein
MQWWLIAFTLFVSPPSCEAAAHPQRPSRRFLWGGVARGSKGGVQPRNNNNNLLNFTTQNNRMTEGTACVESTVSEFHRLD